MMLEMDRSAVIAYRVDAHQFDRKRTRLDRLNVLDLGIQEPRAGSARIALAARLPTDPSATALKATASTWTFRGAPHLHRAADLPALSAALWPADDADAAAKLGDTCAQLRREKCSAVQAIRDTAEAWRAIAGSEPQTKGEISAAVTKRLPSTYSGRCNGCGVTHVLEQLLRLAALPAGAIVAAPGPPVSFTMTADWPGPPERAAGAQSLVNAYLRLHGPAGPSEVAGYLGTKAAALDSVWPDDLVEVLVDGRRRYLAKADVDALSAAPAPRLVRLLPPSDPYLQARDRATIVPDKALHKQVWRILGNPGALLIDGEIAGVWRSKPAGKAGLALTITPFGSVPRGRRTDVADEADRVAGGRGLPVARISYDD